MKARGFGLWLIGLLMALLLQVPPLPPVALGDMALAHAQLPATIAAPPGKPFIGREEAQTLRAHPVPVIAPAAWVMPRATLQPERLVWPVLDGRAPSRPSLGGWARAPPRLLAPMI